MAGAEGILVEAESFEDLGGWILDTEFIYSMGSAYLNAHGLGKPVAAANTKVTLPEAGQWHVWVRAKNWAAGDWDAPGQFKLSINGEELEHVFGAGSGEWEWERGGAVEIDTPSLSLALLDLTGFNGRCDAIFFTQDAAVVPDNSSEPMNEWRRRCGQVEDLPDGEFDLVVAGGGIAGCSAAVAGARAGLKVALLHDRAVLGGNASSEVLVDPCGNFVPGRYPDLGQIVQEVAPDMHASDLPPKPFEAAEVTRRKVVEAEPNLELFLDHYVYSVETGGSAFCGPYSARRATQGKPDGSMPSLPGNTGAGRITAVWAMDAHGRTRRRFKGRFFVDATGHGTVGLQAGADYRMEPGNRMGMTNYWKWRWTDHDVEFPECPWALQLTEKAFPYPGDGPYLNKEGKPARIQHDHPLFFSPAKEGYKGQWFWESGFDKHPLNDLEAIRDHNLRAAFGAFNAMKNHGAYADLYEKENPHATAEMYWMACIGGPRETLQILGDVVVSEQDIYGERDFPDACVPATWGIDLHLPLPLWAKENPDNPFISRAHFDGWVDDTKGKWAESIRPGLCGEMRGKHDPNKGYLFPYRSFYSRNIENLFMAGRDLSCTHEALGTIRVMNTLGMVGVVVGRAASIACAHDSTNRGVYEDHFDELKELLSQPGDYVKE